MDTRWRKYSHSLTAKVAAFIITVLCFAGCLTIFINVVRFHDHNLGIANEDSYYLGSDYMAVSSEVFQSLKAITLEYKSEENILGGGSITPQDVENIENRLYRDFRHNSRSYNPNLTNAENYQVFREAYADQIVKEKDKLIQDDLRDYRAALHRLNGYQGLVYYAKSGDSEFTNSPSPAKDYFKAFPAFMVFDGFEQKIFPEEVKKSKSFRYYGLTNDIYQLAQQDVIYFAFTEEFLNPRIAEWQADKQLAIRSLYQMAGLTLAALIALIYLLFVAGRKPEDQGVHLHSFDKLPSDIILILCFAVCGIWLVIMLTMGIYEPVSIFPVTLLLAAPGLVLVLSLAKHIKNRTLLSSSLTYIIFRKIFDFVRAVYNSGNTAVKVVLLVIGYPILIACTFFMFPVTIGAAAWLAFKKVQEFNAIKEGVNRVKEGELHYTINIAGDGEFARLAADINSITDGLNKAVESEIKSERLKSELITNVSHDIRTPLTSIITYVDLLKKETDQAKAAEYIDVIEQKAQRLKVLTDDLFEATKASSGNIPVNFEKIDLVSLITQGLGEFDDKIQACGLDFKISAPDKVLIKADGKLLWRSIENLLLNIFKYALAGSRVYIDINDSGQAVTLTIKNISACELNISADELLERFKRGDASRTSQGSGLGLYIAKSLVEIQNGSFHIEIDGDLFKAVIRMGKAV
ncbi:MAG: HAMP domain-containing sensor histidine kinase [Desulfotomaculaceae bacterium]|nr:HAMP domain-containing sensor histidine kinase [Desulfotomaculaceae bacterium]